MKLPLFTAFLLSIFTLAKAQREEIDLNYLYSETDNNGIIIQNSLPKGGPYTGSVEKHFNYSHLVFFTRIINDTDKPIEVAVNFSADSTVIPNSPDTFVKLFLPADTMTVEKQSLFSYGITDLASFDKATSFQKILNPKEDCLFYVNTIFYQTKPDAINQSKGGNRAEFVLKGQNLFYNMPPQINSLPCGHIKFVE